MLTGRTTWRRDGDDRPVLDPSFWGKDQIVGLWVPVAGGRHIANVAFPGFAESSLTAGGNTQANSPEGLLACDNTTKNGIYNFAGGIIPPFMQIQPPLTFMWFGTVFGNYSTSYCRVMGIEDPAIVNNLEFQRHSTQAVVNFRFMVSSGSGIEIAATSAFANGARQSLAAVCLPTDVATYYNGAAGATSTSDPIQFYDSTTQFCIGACTTLNGYTNTGMFAGLLMNVGLDAERVRDLHRDPSQMWTDTWRTPTWFVLGGAAGSGGAQALAGNIVCVSAVTAALTVQHPLAATVAAASTVTAGLTVPAPVGPVDAFTGSYAAAWTTVGGGCTIVGNRSRQEMAGTHSLISSDYIYTFDDSLAFVEVELDADPDRYVYYYWHNAAFSAGFYILVQNADLIFSVTGQTDYTVTYNATTHRWWRVREANGDLFFDTSADGLAWTQRAARPGHGLTLTSLRLDLGAADLAAGSGNYAYFDNVNVLPGIPLAGTIAATSAATSALTVAHPLAATVAASSTVTAALIVTHPLASIVAAQSALTANLIVTHPLAATVASSSTVTGDLAATHPLAASVATQSAATGDLTVAHTLAGTVAVTSTVTGDLTSALPLAATVEATSTLTGDLAADHTLAAITAATSALTGDLEVVGQIPLAGIIAAQTTATSDLVVDHTLAGTVAAASALTGDLQVAGQVPLTGTITGQTTATGDLVVDHTLAGITAVQTTVTGDLTAVYPLDATVGVVSTLTGDLTVPQTLAGSVAAQTTATGDLTVDHPLVGTVSTASSLTGDLIVAHALAAVTAGQTTIAGAMVALLSLAGQVDAVLALVGSLTAMAPVTTFGPRARHREHARGQHLELSRAQHTEHSWARHFEESRARDIEHSRARHEEEE